MSKRKILTAVMAVCTLCMLFTGCMRADIGITFSETDGGSIEYGVYIESDRFNEISAMFGNPFEGETTETKLFGEKEYIGVTEKKEYDSTDGLVSALKELTFSDDMMSEPDNETELTETDSNSAPVMPEADSKVFRSVSYEVADNRCVFKAELNPQSYDEQIIGMDFNTKDMFKLVFTVTMPYYVSSATAGTTQEKTVVWEIDDVTAENSIEIISQASTFPTMAVIAVIGIVILVIIFALLISRKPKQQI